MSEPDYTSENEDISTWPETRGPEWREMGLNEVMRFGDVIFNGVSDEYEWVDGFDGSKFNDEEEALEAWTRRPIALNKPLDKAE